MQYTAGNYGLQSVRCGWIADTPAQAGYVIMEQL
jgi:hypothetical protein